MRLVDNLYCYVWTGRGNNCHSYLFRDVLRGRRRHVLIDPGHLMDELRENCLDRLLDAMSKDGLRPEDIGLIVNTHAHPDHCEASETLASRGNDQTSEEGGRRALIALSRAEDDFRRVSGGLAAQGRGASADPEPDFYLQEGDLNLGQGDSRMDLQILSLPGHTPGSIGIYWPRRKVLVTGDVVFNGSVGRTDIPGGDGRLLKQSIQRLEALDVEYLLPGHSTQFGNIIRGKQQVVQNFAFLRINYFPLL